MGNKIIGYLALMVSVILTLVFLLKFDSILNTFKDIEATSGSREQGQLFGKLIYWLIHVIFMTLLFRKGIKRIKNTPK